ncbi:trigger factor [Parabacteroides sp. PF5-5]|uniref:trigger factor n=1 Tax=unclassified Parabacteroides TaxID=2649774 RepID=UPI002473A374|nr:MULTISPECIES: trigger factor [unclassified Parabacteroides]MDH6305026.1 trigger factor [Parabacteroides sp. PH5-39]MDH6315889.1 trigger factor [Parabacteroides sp. PF5-13]MDH6319546.1 trigger factor [Parabacteroides sp. PH5-13]MDH6323277.1 trigger factor [Parabacteroides sp. PH5-8]MDH6327215.1 trigger factor [Parabacteroides sp. PH5-41]
MNISLKNNEDAVSGVLKIEVVKADYADKVEKSLRSFRQKANVPGFRKGMVPMGMIKKMYGKNVLIEEVNKLVSESLYNYIRENNLNILGEPLPNEAEHQYLDFDDEEDFNFHFDIAFAPEIDIDLTKRDKMNYYQVIVDEDMVNKQIESYCANFGTYDDTDEPVEEKDLVKGKVTELENGAPKEGGIALDDALLMPMYLKEADEKSKFVGAKKGSAIVFNPAKAYEGAEAEIASFLKVEKSEVPNIKSDFSFEITEVTRHKLAEINQELFDKVFGDGIVTTEEDFRSKVKDSVVEQFTPQSDYKFQLDTRKLFLKKAGDVAFADNLLKRWLLASDENKTEEQVDAEYPQIVEDLKYHLAKESLVKKNDIKIENTDIDIYARRIAKAQFAQYGMYTVPDDLLDNYAKDMLKNKQSLQSVIDKAIEDKLSAWLKGKVKLETKEVSVDEFNKLFEE